MAQKEKTVQPSTEERNQTEEFQKTRDIAADQINQQLSDRAEANPSVNLPPAAENAEEGVKQTKKIKDDDDDDDDTKKHKKGKN